MRACCELPQQDFGSTMLNNKPRSDQQDSSRSSVRIALLRIAWRHPGHAKQMSAEARVATEAGLVHRQEGSLDFAEPIVYNLQHEMTSKTEQMERQEQMIEQKRKHQKKDSFALEHALVRIMDNLKSWEQWYGKSDEPKTEVEQASPQRG